MNVSLAVVADYSNVSREGKLNILGIFNQVRAAAFPFILPAMQLVMTFEAQSTEIGRPKDLRVQLMDPDGRQILEIGGQFTLQAAVPGEIIKTNHIINFNNIAFPRAGDYVFSILISTEEKARVPFKVIQLPR